MKRIIKRFRIDNRIRVGYGTAFFLLLISYLLTLYANRQLLEQANMVDHTNKVIKGLEELGSNMKDAETGVKGFIMMKDRKFLDPFYTSHARVDSVFKTVSQFVADNPVQKQRIDTVKSLIAKKYEILNWAKEHYAQTGFVLDDSLKSSAYVGKVVMDNLISTISLMQIHEERELKNRGNELKAKFSALNAIVIVSLVIAFLLVIFGFITYISENKARRMADQKVQDYQEQLKERINELAKANKELIQMRSIEKFAATGRIARTIAHEVRNPLTNINLAIDQLRSELPELDENSAVMLDMVNRNSQRINHLITDLLNSTKFSELNNAQHSVNTLLDEAVELAKDRITLNNIKVEKFYSNDICDVSVDDEKIKIAFLNLIVNAIEAMEPGKGVLKLETLGLDGKCVVRVTDNGVGMDAESLGRLFEPYFTSKMKGSGLGLTNTQNIILNHKGTISAESEKGKGTTFTIVLDFAV